MGSIEPFFVTEGTLAQSSPSYISRQADRDLLEFLEHGDFAYVLDSRQKGKSSLMVRTREALEAKGVSTVLLDLQRFGSNLDPERWYASLLHVVGEQLDCEERLFELWDEQIHAGPMLKFFGAIAKITEGRGKPCVVFVDEVDFVRSLPFSTDEFFAGIRECHNRRASGPAPNVSFCLLGVATPSELIRDVRITPFNIGRRVELADFTTAELAPFILPLSETGRDGAALLKRIHHWTGGHPYLTQKLASAVTADPQVRSASGVDRLVEEMFFSLKARTQDPNLSDVSRRVLESPVEGVGAEEARSRVLDLYRQVREGRVRDDETDPVVTVLKLSGLTTVLQGYLAVRNRVYFRAFDRAWVEANLPEAEAMRQRRAARRAAMRVGVVAGGVAVAVGGLALFGLVQTARANVALKEARVQKSRADQKANEAESRAASETAAKNLAQLAQAESDGKTKEARRALSDRDRALASARSETRRANDEKANALLAKREADSQRRVAIASKAESDHLFYQANMDLIQSAWDKHQFNRAQWLLDETVKPAYASSRGPEWGLSNLRMHTELATLTPTGDTCIAAAFSPDGLRALTVSEKAGVQVWDSRSGALLLTVPGTKGDLEAAYSPDGAAFYAAGERTVTLFNAGGRKIATLRGQRCAHFSPDGSRMLSFGRDVETATIWNARTGKEIVHLDGKFVASQLASFSPDGSRILTLDDISDQHAWKPVPSAPRLWDAAEGRLISNLRQAGATTSSVAHTSAFGGTDLFTVVRWALFSPDSRTVATAGDGPDVQIWSASSGAEVDVLKSESSSVGALAFSPDSATIAAEKRGAVVSHGAGSIESDPIGDAAVFTWNLKAKGAPGKSWLLAPRLENAGSGDGWVVFSPGGDRFVAGAPHTKAKVFSMASNEALPLKGSLDAASPEFSSDGGRVSLFSEGVVGVWDSRSAHVVEMVPCSGSGDAGGACKLSMDGLRLLAVGTKARIYDARASHESLNLTGFEKGAISPDGRRVVTIDADNMCPVVLDGETGQEISRNRHRAGYLAFSPDGSLVASSYGDYIFFWDPVTGLDIRPPIATQSKTYLFNIGFTADSRSVVLQFDGSWRKWNVASGKEVLLGKKSAVPEIELEANSVDGSQTIIRNARTGRKLYALEGALEGSLDEVKLSASGKRIITAGHGKDAAFRVWDTSNGRQLIALPSEDGGFPSATFSKDERKILTLNGRSLQVWPLSHSAASKMTFVQQEAWVAAQLKSAADAQDLYSWSWQLHHWLAPDLVKSKPVQDVLADASETASSPISDDALRLLVKVPADYNRKRAEHFADAGELKEAESAIAEQVKVSSGSISDWKMLALLRLGRNDENGYLDAARRAVALALTPGASGLEVIDAAIVARVRPDVLGDYGPLMEAVDRAKQSDPDSLKNASTPGSVLFRMGRYAEAAKELRPTVAGDSPNHFSEVCLAMCLIRLGRLPEAFAMLKRAEVWSQTELATQTWDYQVQFKTLVQEAHATFAEKGSKR